MDWTVIESISAAVGAVCILATVFYLAKQVRHNTRAIEGSTEQMLMSLEKDIYTLIVDNPNVYRRGVVNPSELNPDELVQFEYIITAFMSLIYSAYVQYQRDLISDEVWDAYKADMTKNLAEPGFFKIWSKIKDTYPSSFAVEISNIAKTKITMT
jgi:hypothetical protein